MQSTGVIVRATGLIPSEYGSNGTIHCYLAGIFEQCYKWRLYCLVGTMFRNEMLNTLCYRTLQGKQSRPSHPMSTPNIQTKNLRHCPGNYIVYLNIIPAVPFTAKFNCKVCSPHC